MLARDKEFGIEVLFYHKKCSSKEKQGKGSPYLTLLSQVREKERYENEEIKYRNRKNLAHFL